MKQNQFLCECIPLDYFRNTIFRAVQRMDFFFLIWLTNQTDEEKKFISDWLICFVWLQINDSVSFSHLDCYFLSLWKRIGVVCSGGKKISTKSREKNLFKQDKCNIQKLFHFLPDLQVKLSGSCQTNISSQKNILANFLLRQNCSKFPIMRRWMWCCFPDKCPILGLIG